LVAVHLCGQSCEMESIYALCQKYNVKIIEDASHAIGGKYKGRFIGNCHYSDITVFSFHPVKIITTAEGGMALTNNAQLAEKMELLRSHGITREPEKMTQEPDGGWYYQQIDLGFNYRMTDIQAALGCSQLERLDQYVESRNRLAERYDRLLDDLPLTTPYRPQENYSAFHLYVIRLHCSELAASHKQVFQGLRECGIGVNLHYIPIYTHPYYESMGFRVQDYPESESYYSEAISLPLFPTMSDSDQDNVVDVLRRLLMK